MMATTRRRAADRRHRPGRLRRLAAVARLAGFVTLAALLAGLLAPPAAAAASAPAWGPVSPPVPTIPVLGAIKATHHPGYDRLVFQFRGGLPTRREVRYVPEVIGDPSGEPVPIVGNAFLHVVFSSAVGHDDAGNVTYGPTRRTFALPDIIQVVNAGDFEAVLSFGVGLARREPFRAFTLNHPSRVVIDVATPFRTVPVRDYFLFQSALAAARPPYVRAVRRPVIPPGVAAAALQRLFAGPTPAEHATGLRFVASGASGFADLSIRDGVARVRLTGGCSSGGSAFTIADEIMPTLRQFRTVRWVKIYDPAGHTQHPTGRTDSVPDCLRR